MSLHRLRGGERTPARPGPGPLPEAALRALDLTVARRVEGLLAGDYRSLLLGRGTDLAQIRPYEPETDDVRHIDWKVTARTGIPHVRVQLAERVLVTWLVLDVSPSMDFGTTERRKADVAEGVALALGYAATRRGNRLGVVVFGGDGGTPVLPPRQGRVGMMGLLLGLRGEAVAGGATAATLGDAIRRTAKLSRQRSLAVVVSDFRGPREWRRPLLELAGRNEVVAVEIRDPREQELPDAGELRLVDPETGRQVRVNTSSEALRWRFATAAEEERREVAALIAASGARHVVLSTSGDWLRALTGFFRSRPLAR
jgi:uncharacterized protein (DUF58 family)